LKKKIFSAHGIEQASIPSRPIKAYFNAVILSALFCAFRGMPLLRSRVLRGAAAFHVNKRLTT